MTDNEIIKALECCANYEKPEDCIGCPIRSECNQNVLEKYSLDLIKRQQEEIEKLTINMNAFGLGMKREKENADIAKAEAVKEFAERLKEKSDKYSVTSFGYAEMVFEISEDDIDNLVKEIVGDTE